jgi:hypothetical protein
VSLLVCKSYNGDDFTNYLQNRYNLFMSNPSCGAARSCHTKLFSTYADVIGNCSCGLVTQTFLMGNIMFFTRTHDEAVSFWRNAG